jgi:hypothetical protein
MLGVGGVSFLSISATIGSAFINNPAFEAAWQIAAAQSRREETPRRKCV